VIAIALSVAAAAPAHAQAPSPAPYVNGSVFSTLVDGDTLYVGGTFTAAGTSAGPLSLLSPADGSVVRTFRGFSGAGTPIMYNKPPLNANAVVADGAGGWYVGGGFDRVDGLPRTSLAHIRPDGSVDPAFRADVVGTVTALALHGSTLWVGGALDEIGGAPFYDLGAVDAATGAPLPVDPPHWNWITDLAVADGRLYVASGSGLISADAETGVRDGWKPEIYGSVEDIAVKDGIVFVAGNLERSWPGSDRRPGAVALRASDASLVAQYDAIYSGWAIEPGDGVVVVRGSSYGTQGRTIRAFDTLTGADRGLFEDVVSYGKGPIAVSGDRVYFAGLSETPGGFASFDLRTGARVPWSPSLLGGRVFKLVAAGGVIAAGGYQGALDGVPRSNLAAFDLRTGAVLPFAPEPRVKTGFFDPPVTPMVTALARAGSLLYIGGRFDSVGGTPQTNLAAVDPVSGARSPFPQATAKVHELAPLGGTLFAGGLRGKLGSVQNDGLGAVSLADGAVLPFAPAMGCDVHALAVSGHTLHAGGCFGVRSYRDLAQVPGPAASGAISSLLGDGAGGLFAGGERGVAHFDATGGSLGEIAAADGPVYALALAGSTLSVGGGFTRLQGAPRTNFGQVRLGDGAVTAFDPAPTSSVTTLATPADGGLVIGGWMDSTRVATTAGLARFAVGGGPPAPTPTATPTATASPTVTATPTTTATAAPTPAATPGADATPSPTPLRAGPSRGDAVVTPTRVKIVEATADRVTVRVTAPAAGREVVRVRLAAGRKVVGRTVVTFESGVARTVRIEVAGRRGRRVYVEAGTAKSAVSALRESRARAGRR
jgi:hypothetical protein